MIRLLLVLAPAACCLAAIGTSTIISSFLPFIREGLAACEKITLKTSSQYKLTKPSLSVISLIGFLAVIGLGHQCIRFVQHCVWTSAMAYSSPSIVMSQQLRDGSRIIQDDFREAYYWLRMNTKPDAKIMSWWDYGHLITYIAKRIPNANPFQQGVIGPVGSANYFISTSEDEANKVLDKKIFLHLN
jgi:dolichyl-diphosphooligosaccharide--protein glycosyltransferase